jgi:hypothetical protein
MLHAGQGFLHAQTLLFQLDPLGSIIKSPCANTVANMQEGLRTRTPTEPNMLCHAILHAGVFQRASAFT